MSHAEWSCGWHDSCYHQLNSWIPFIGPSIIWHKLNSTLKGWINDLWMCPTEDFCISLWSSEFRFTNTMLKELWCTLFSFIEEKRRTELKRSEIPNIPLPVPLSCCNILELWTLSINCSWAKLQPWNECFTYFKAILQLSTQLYYFWFSFSLNKLWVFQFG